MHSAHSQVSGVGRLCEGGSRFAPRVPGNAVSMATPRTSIRNLDRRQHQERRRDPDGACNVISTLLARRACATPDGAAFVDSSTGAVATWLELAHCAQSWRERYPADLQGRRNSLLVGVVAGSGSDFCREVMAALAAGVPTAPMNSELSSAELLWASATLGLTHLALDGAEPVELRNFRLGRGGLEAYENALPRAVRNPSRHSPGMSGSNAGTAGDDTPAMVLRTRGWTGPPKLVPVSSAQLLGSARTLADHFGLGPSDCGVVTGPLSRADRLTMMLAALTTGGTVVVDAASSGVTWADVDRSEATWMSLAPEDVEDLARTVEAREQGEDRLRYVHVTADSVPRSTHAAFWQHTGVPLIETYSLTEAAGLVAANSLAIPARRRPGSVGLPIGVDVRIVDDFGKTVAAADTGRIQVRGATVSPYYLSYGRDRSMIPSIDAEGWLSTGDLGLFRHDGSLVVTGREGNASAWHATGAAGRSSQVPCGTPADPLRAAAFRP